MMRGGPPPPAPFEGETIRPEGLAALIGCPIGVSRWVEIDLSRIAAYELVVGADAAVPDPGPDAPRGGGAPASPFLVLSLLGAMARDVIPRLEGAVMGINYGFNGVRFGPSVSPGRRVRGRFRLKAAERRSQNEWLLTHTVVVEVEDREDPALEADWVVLRIMAPARD